MHLIVGNIGYTYMMVNANDLARGIFSLPGLRVRPAMTGRGVWIADQVRNDGGGVRNDGKGKVLSIAAADACN